MKKVLFLTIGCFLITGVLFSQTKNGSKYPPIGLVFNVGNVLEGIESYQGGIGIKYIKDKTHWRFLYDIYYDYGSELFSNTFGVAQEYHTRTDKISPFLGWAINSGFNYIKYTQYSSTKITEITIPIQLSGLFGIEWYLNEFISLSAEYTIGVKYSFTTYNSSATENEIKNSLVINTGLGNSGKIGLTIYLNDMIINDDKE